MSDLTKVLVIDPTSERAITIFSDGTLLTGMRYIVAMSYNANGDIEYLGRATVATSSASAGWQIRKLTYDGSNNLTGWGYASGNILFDKIWDNRASYVYS